MSLAGKMSNFGGHPLVWSCMQILFYGTLLFEWWSSGKDDWCRNGSGGDRCGCGGGWEGGLSKCGHAVGGGCIDIADGLGCVRDGGGDNKGCTVMNSEGAKVGRGVIYRDCCRLPEVIQELWEHLPKSFPFFF